MLATKSSRLTGRVSKVETPAPAMLVLAESYYHNWTAQVDGESARLWQANSAFEAVQVPGGLAQSAFVVQGRGISCRMRDLTFFDYLLHYWLGADAKTSVRT